MSLGTISARLLFPVVERLQGRSIRPKLAQLRAEAAGSVEARRRRQAARLEAICRHAGNHVPYYRDLFAAHGFTPDGLTQDPSRLEQLPPLGRDQMREAGPRLLDERLDPDTLHLRRTGGSTGASALLYYSDEALDWTAAVNFFAREWAGQSQASREAHLSTAPGQDIPFRDRLRERVKCASLNRTNLPIAGWDAGTLDGLFSDLARMHPGLVQGHPSTLHALACHLRERGLRPAPLFGTFESTGETLDPGVRKTIEDVLGCRVVNRYGSAEFGVVAYERPGGRPGMEILDAVVFAEALAPGDADAATHDPELVLTGLLNPAMPLIRYRTGDRVRLARESDEIAGRIESMQGRIHDVVELDGAPIPTHVLQDRLDGLGCVEEFQVEVGGGRLPLLRIATDAREHERVRAQVAAWWGDAVEVEFTGRESFLRTGWRGKFRHRVDRGGQA